MKMEKNVVTKPLFNVEESVIAQPLVKPKEVEVSKPLLAGIIYGEIVFWMMLASVLIAIPGLIIYIRSGGFLDSTNLLAHLWQGSDCLTIWKEVGGVSQPLSWYSCLGMLNKGDMLAVLGLVITGIAAVVGMWGAFLGMFRSRNKLYTLFAFLIAVILTLSAVGILKLHV
jgi:hypothetical protein